MKKIVLFIFVLSLCGCSDSSLFDEYIYDSERYLKVALADIIVPDDYVKIQDAVNAAVDGQKIIIKEGDYPEWINISGKNNLTLIGQGATIIPPFDVPENGDPHRSLGIYGCSDISILNLNFDGKYENQDEYPVYCAIGFNHSSGKALNNYINGYHVGIACYNMEETTQNIVLKENNISDINGQGINVIGNFEMGVEKNNISCSFDYFWDIFPDWFGIIVTGGNGEISNNVITFNQVTYYPERQTGIQVFERNPNSDGWLTIFNTKNMLLEENHIQGTEVGIRINDEWCDGWSIKKLKLLYNTFLNVDEEYLIYNNNVRYKLK